MDEHDRGDGGDGRRRRRRRRRGGRGGEESHHPAQNANHPAPAEPQGGGGRRGRNSHHRGDPRVREDNNPPVSLPRTGRLPRARSALHPHRGAVASGMARRRRLNRSEVDSFGRYLAQMPEPLVAALYSGLGGQPSRVTGGERMIQLAVKAIGQGNRLQALVKGLHQRDRQALAILVQCGGIGHCEELRAELILSLGGTDREWKKVLSTLGDKGLVASTEERDGDFFYLIPEPLMDVLVETLSEDLVLPHFDSDEVRVIDPRPFSPPFDFSMVTLATYIDQHPPRLTQRHDIFKVHKDEMDQFFAQLWTSDSELFSFHIQFLMMHGMVELKGDRLAVNRAVVEEWLQLDAEDQRDLVFASMEKHFPQGEWVLWAIADAKGAWVPERPLSALYRRWRRGEEWRERLHKGTWASPKQSTQRDSYTFTPLINTGMVELGQWGQEKFYRLTPRARRLLSPPEEEGFSQFYLTPSFEIMAPAGMAPILFFRIGEMAELTACDRANTYKITEVSIEQALAKGWRRDDILEFLRENSQIGLPDNVEQTLRGWMGHHGDVEFHDVMLLTVHRSQIRRLESHRKLKPFLLHRFVPGMYAVDRSRMPELLSVLGETGFSPTNQVRKYPDDPQQVDARERLLKLVVDAREDREDVVRRAQMADTLPENLHPVPGSNTYTKAQAAKNPAPPLPPREKGERRKKEEGPPRRSPGEVLEHCERAISANLQLDMLYVTRDQQRKLLRVAPERMAINQQGQQVLVARDVAKGERLSYQLVQIERIAYVEGGKS